MSKKIEFKYACEIARKFFLKKYGDAGFCSILDIGDYWLFNSDNKEHEAVYGRQGITVNKYNGEIAVFLLPDKNNFELLDAAVDIDIPKEYIA